VARRSCGSCGGEYCSGRKAATQYKAATAAKPLQRRPPVGGENAEGGFRHQLVAAKAARCRHEVAVHQG